MRCDEIQERLIDLLYSERGTPSASPELQAHVDSCPACRKELEGLKDLRGTLKLWKDEPPLRPVSLPGWEYASRSRQPVVWRAMRYAAIAAMLLIAFLTLANAEITWNKEGFSYKNHMLPWGASKADYYSKAEVRDIIKRVRDDSEAEMTETTRLMVERLLDTIDQDRLMDLRLIRRSSAQDRSKN
jgi:hypothetical protein